MEEIGYSVSEAVRLVGVESHVLRYWEEELGITVSRTSQGHRLYSQENIQVFQRVKRLKEKGLQLKAIRTILDTEAGEEGTEDISEQIFRLAGEREEFRKAEQEDTEQDEAEQEGIEQDEAEQDGAEQDDTGQEESEEYTFDIVPTARQEDSLGEFTAILRRMIQEVVETQNKQLERALAIRIREELEEQYLQYLQALRETAAGREMKERQKKGLREWIRNLLGL